MTVDKSRLPPQERPALPDFTPVPRKPRHDGWTPERQRGFIEALSDTGSVKAAAHAVNMTPEGAYYLRRQPGAEGFRAAWEAALGHGVRRLADVGLERALHGVEVPVYHFGAVVGTRRVYNDRLLMFYLRNRLPELFAADSRNPELDFGALRRKLEKQWRAEWEQQRAIEDAAEDDALLDGLDRQLDAMRERRALGMSPRTRALYAEAERSQAEDEAAGYYDMGANDDDAPPD